MFCVRCSDVIAEDFVFEDQLSEGAKRSHKKHHREKDVKNDEEQQLSVIVNSNGVRHLSRVCTRL